MKLDALFKTHNSDRDKFLSRLFGIFNEQIIRIWCRDDRSPYRDLGRPTIGRGSETRGSTLDFTFENTETLHKYVAEMKCELQYKDYRYLTLTDPSQLDHHRKEAFARFLEATKHPDEATVTIPNGRSRKPIEIQGGILVWGSVAERGRSTVMKQCGFVDVLSVEDAIADLNIWRNVEFREHLEERRSWCESLFGGLMSSR